MIHDAHVIIFRDQDLANTMAFDVIQRTMRPHGPKYEKTSMTLKEAHYFKYYATLVIWSLSQTSRMKKVTNIDASLKGNIILQMVRDISISKGAYQGVEYFQFFHGLAHKSTKEKDKSVLEV